MIQLIIKTTTMQLFIGLLVSFMAISCSGRKSDTDNRAFLKETGKVVRFNLDEETKYNAFYLYVFPDESGRKYLSFLHYRSNQLLFYDFNTGNLVFKINLASEGPDGIVQPSGYFIKDLNHIYLTSYSYNGIVKVDTASHIVDRIPYAKTDVGFEMIPSYTPSSHPYTAPCWVDGSMFLMPPLVERFCPADKTPVCVRMDTLTRQFTASTMTYGDMLSEKELKAQDARVSRIFDGEHFVYSFYVDDEILVTDINHSELKRVQAKSAYINSPLEKQKTGVDGPRSNLEVARYGDVLHDAYRKVYYRFVYPQTELDGATNWRGRAVYGRKRFSVMILDEQFHVIGETLFPESVYNSYVFFVDEDGLHISRDYQMGSGNQTDDYMTFELFELVK